MRSIIIISFVAAIFLGFTDPEKNPHTKKEYQTRNVVIVVIDGPRYSETWGSEEKEHIPRLANFLSKEGVVNTSFYNTAPTYTNAGHTAITTGVRQHINNGGQELPQQVSIFQKWREATGQPAEKAWVIASKDKLHILSDTKNRTYAGKFNPEINCGNRGPGSGYRPDSVTLQVTKELLQQHRPNLVLVNFKEPDARGHQGDWKGYLNGIRTTDEYVWQLWQFLQQDPHYRQQTTLILTNDHGRHIDNHRDGFVSHGDRCKGCKHLNFFAAGPDFKRNLIISEKYNQTDISATVAELLGFKMETSEGEVMWEVFKDR
ncbi:MAG TPA: alkaline phosphatase family protein [Adhaeribacter sp.]|nr:alkaline phosphatase family protein [Adhaeribacter sp.]